MLKTIKNASVTVASKGLGAIHFLGQTMADVAMETEAAMKLRADGIDKQQSKESRVLKTIEHQQYFIDKYERTISSFQFVRDRLLRRDLFNEEIITMSVHEISAEELLTK